MIFLENLKAKIRTKYFNYSLLLILIITFVFLFFLKNNIRKTKNSELNKTTNNELMIFVQDGCIHCKHAEEFLSVNIDKYKNINFIFYNLKNRESQVLLFKNISKLNIPKENIGTPIFIMDNKYIIGFGEKEKSNLIRLLNEKKIRESK